MLVRAAAEKRSRGRGKKAVNVVDSMDLTDYQRLDEGVLDELRQRAVEEEAAKAGSVDEEDDPRRVGWHRSAGGHAGMGAGVGMDGVPSVHAIRA